MPAAVSATRERGSGRERVLCNTLVLMEKPDQELWGGEQSPGAGSALQCSQADVGRASVVWDAARRQLKHHCGTLLALRYLYTFKSLCGNRGGVHFQTVFHCSNQAHLLFISRSLERDTA